MFADLVSIVTAAWAPVDQKLVLTDPVTDPVKTHVKCFCRLSLNPIIGESNSSCVIYLDRGGRLGMSELCESNAEREGIAGGQERGCNLGFGSGAHDVGEYFGEDMDDAVGGDGRGRGLGGVGRTGTEEVDASGAAAGSVSER